MLTNLPEARPQFDDVPGDDKKKYEGTVNKRNQELNELYYGNAETRRAGAAASGSSSKRSKRSNGR